MFGFFASISVIEMYLGLYDLINLEIPRLLIYNACNKPLPLNSIFGNLFFTGVIHFVVFLIMFIKVIKNMVKTHNVHGDITYIEHEHDVHHIFPQLFSVIAFFSGVLSCCFKIMNHKNPTPLFITICILISAVFTFVPCFLLLFFSRTKHQNKKWLIILAVILFICYKLMSVLPFFSEYLDDYYKFTIYNSFSSWFMVIGYTVLLVALFIGADCHKTLKLMLTALVIVTIVPYRTIIFSESIEYFIYSLFSLLTAVYMPLSLDLLVHKALPEREIKDEQTI